MGKDQRKGPGQLASASSRRLRLLRPPERRLACRRPSPPTSIVYLAAPYSDPDPVVRMDRFQRVNLVAARLAAAGDVVFSPITMTHPLDALLAEEGETLGTDYWLRYDEAFMQVCRELWVLCIPGWQSSKGVCREIEYFKQRGRKIRYIDECGNEAAK